MKPSNKNFFTYLTLLLIFTNAIHASTKLFDYECPTCNNTCIIDNEEIMCTMDEELRDDICLKCKNIYTSQDNNTLKQEFNKLCKLYMNYAIDEKYIREYQLKKVNNLAEIYIEKQKKQKAQGKIVSKIMLPNPLMDQLKQETMLHWMSQRGPAENIISLLLQNPKINSTAQNIRGETPLDLARVNPKPKNSILKNHRTNNIQCFLKFNAQQWPSYKQERVDIDKLIHDNLQQKYIQLCTMYEKSTKNHFADTTFQKKIDRQHDIVEELCQLFIWTQKQQRINNQKKSIINLEDRMIDHSNGHTMVHTCKDRFPFTAQLILQYSATDMPTQETLPKKPHHELHNLRDANYEPKKISSQGIHSLNNNELLKPIALEPSNANSALKNISSLDIRSPKKKLMFTDTAFDRR